MVDVVVPADFISHVASGDKHQLRRTVENARAHVVNRPRPQRRFPAVWLFNSAFSCSAVATCCSTVQTLIARSKRSVKSDYIVFSPVVHRTAESGMPSKENSTSLLWLYGRTCPTARRIVPSAFGLHLRGERHRIVPDRFPGSSRRPVAPGGAGRSGLIAAPLFNGCAGA